MTGAHAKHENARSRGRRFSTPRPFSPRVEPPEGMADGLLGSSAPAGTHPKRAAHSVVPIARRAGINRYFGWQRRAA